MLVVVGPSVLSVCIARMENSKTYSDVTTWNLKSSSFNFTSEKLYRVSYFASEEPGTIGLMYLCSEELIPIDVMPVIAIDILSAFV
jgi:hypothetical protein